MTKAFRSTPRLDSCLNPVAVLVPAPLTGGFDVLIERQLGLQQLGYLVDKAITSMGL